MKHEKEFQNDPLVPLNVDVPEGLRDHFKSQMPLRKTTMRREIEGLIRQWLSDREGVAQVFAEAYYNGPTGIKVQLVSLLNEIREFNAKQQKTASKGTDAGRQDKLSRPRNAKTA